MRWMLILLPTGALATCGGEDGAEAESESESEAEAESESEAEAESEAESEDPMCSPDLAMHCTVMVACSMWPDAQQCEASLLANCPNGDTNAYLVNVCACDLNYGESSDCSAFASCQATVWKATGCQ